MTKLQWLKTHLFGYGFDDAPYKPWALAYLEWRAARHDWSKVAWQNGWPRPVIGKDARRLSDAEFRALIKQRMGIK